ncbi:pyridoxal phosphate-dependent aminotransferase [Turneriella parva]|uniref:Aminotransferase n=1 Tax=Turneriella parva (strain ATCC BAA-1111 / DSM 21527 / NCTC 11395 / H) TaxID=869212 RepID=I4B0G8_TURPD|nr:pyridoxal phosphate-dependent aminotransferase [Turneriella parva]AFM10775.1 aminotransferase class I and II [Turneriella parva DSM 21527]
MQLARRLELIEPSPTLAITARANELKAEGKDIVGFGAGEPDFDTPAHIKAAAIEALNKGFTKYTPVSGIPELKQAIITKFQRDNQLDFKPNQIIVGTGGKQVLYNFFLAVINDGDEVVCPAPYWVSYKDIVRLAGGEMKLIHTTFESGFKLSPHDIEKNVSAKTRVFILNSPSNPTGATYTPDEIRALAAALEKYPDLLVVTDDIYEKLAYGTDVLNIATASEKLRPRTVVVNGLSKAYSMTGWRLGYAGGPKEIIAAMDMIQGQSTSNPTSFSQKGAVAALNAEQQCVEDMRVVFEKRRDLAFNLLSNLKGLRVFKPQGAFYLFPDIAGLTAAPGWPDLKKRTGETDTGKIFSTGLLNEKLVAVVPGSAFGYENGFRISYATSEAQIEKGLGRVREFVDALWA